MFGVWPNFPTTFTGSKERELVLSVENNSLKMKVKANQKKMDEMKQEMVGQNEKWEKYEEKNESLKNEWELKMQTLEDNVEFYRDQGVELENKIVEMKEKLAKHEKEEEDHLAKEKNLETEMEEYRKITEKLQREVESQYSPRTAE